jgi:hypothetical protein
MPSTNEVIRFRNKLSTLDRATRAALLQESVQWAEREAEKQKGAAAALKEFSEHLKEAIPVETIDAAWFKKLSLTYCKHSFFERFLYRLR